MLSFLYYSTPSYHDRHQPTHYPLYYGEQQDQSRESTYWTVPGSRSAGALQEYTNWTDPELSAPPPSSHFPFILRRHTQHHQDLGEYQLQEARDREWKATHRPVRDHERGFLREGWQRRWDTCSPVRYNREVSTKRSDSSYRELEAWAARYSHSLPRRRRIEAELRGASQGLVESTRIGLDPQHVKQPGMWDRGGRQQTPTYYPSQAPAPDASNVLDMKENASYQRKIYNQPPGYIAPPPYNSPHKPSPVTHSSDTVWEQDTKKQHCYSQPTHRKQHVSAELQDKSKGEKEELTNLCESKTCPKFEGLKRQRFEADALQAVCPIGVQQTLIQDDGTLHLQHPQVFQNSEINRETSSKVIEGRKFRLSKKTGGMTIFCLVSRIAGPTETPSLPVCTSKMNIEHTDVREASKLLGATTEATQKLPDEVDFKSPTLTEQSDNGAGRKQRETPPCTEKDMVENNQAKKAQADVVPPQKENANDVCRQGGQSVQPVSIKYPSWREPSFTSKAETESPPTCCLKGIREDKLSDDCVNVSSPPVDTEVMQLDNQENAEDIKSMLVVDTTCVVVKMEQIPSPTKERVHFLSTAALAEESQLDAQVNISPELNFQLNQDVTTDESTEEASSCKIEKPETDVDSTLLEEEEGKQESLISLPCLLSSHVSERETLEARAERILGIPLHDCITEPETGMPLVKSSAEDQDEGGEPSPLKTDTEDAFKQTPEDAAEDEPYQNPLEDHQTKDSVTLNDHSDSRDQVASEDGGDFMGSQDQASDRHERSDTDVPLETGNKTLSETEKTEDALLESTDEKGTSEHGREDDRETQPPKPSDLLSLIPSDHHSPSNISESNAEAEPDPELAALNTADIALPPATSSPSPLQQLPSFSLDGESSSLSSPHADSQCLLPPLVLTDQPAVETSRPEEEEAQTLHVTQSDLINEPEVLMSQEQHECGQLDDDACVNDEQQNNRADEESIKPLEENDINSLQQNLESVQTEGVLCLKESHVSEEQPEAGLPAESSEVDEECEENAGQTEAEVLQQLDCGQDEDVFCIKESHMTENELQTNSDELTVEIREQILCKNNSSDSQSETQIEILQDVDPQTDLSNSSPPLAADCEVSLLPLDELFLPQLPSPHQSTFECECVCLLDTSPLHPDTAATGAIPETLPPPVSPEASPSSFSESPPVLPPSSTPPYEEESFTLSPDFLQSEAHKQALQYPKSLWDVVNRIRKHTAPDSENEEEEVTELWDPENLGSHNVAADTTSEKTAFDEVEQQVSEECAEVGDIQHDHKEVRGDIEEDTLSCSSTSSHGSGDTVIGADENEAEEAARDAEMEQRTEKESEVFKTAEAELHYSSEVNVEAEGGEEEEEDEADINEPFLSSECAPEIMEKEVECEVIEL